MSNLNISDKEKKVLEELHDMDLLFSKFIEKTENDNYKEKKGESSDVLEAIKSVKEGVEKKINLWIWSVLYVEELTKINNDIWEKYDKIMKLNEQKKDEWDKSSGTWAISVWLIATVVNWSISDTKRRKRF